MEWVLLVLFHSSLRLSGSLPGARQSELLKMGLSQAPSLRVQSSESRLHTPGARSLV